MKKKGKNKTNKKKKKVAILELLPIQSMFTKKRMLLIIIYILTASIMGAIYDNIYLIPQKRVEIEYYNTMAKVYLTQDNNSAALDASNKALAIDSTSPDALYNRVIALRKLNRCDEVLKFANKELEKVRTDREASIIMRSKGDCLIYKGHIDEGFKVIDEATSLDPDDPDNRYVYYNIGIFLRNINKNEEALRSFNKALAISPDFKEASEQQISILFELGRFEDIINKSNQLLAVSPDYLLIKYSFLKTQ